MSTPRFLVSSLPEMGIVALDESESRHASKVLRLGVGDRVVLFADGGYEADGKIVSVGKRTVDVEIERRTDTNRELAHALHMFVALPKGDRQKSLVDGLVQLGVASLVPLITARGVAQPSGASAARLQRMVVESSKQCGRNQLMTIGEPLSVDQLVPSEDCQLSLFAHPYGDASPLGSFNAAKVNLRPARVAIGPEGGFTDREVEQLRSFSWGQVSLGSRILRVEMAALMAAAWWASL
jgi:16S rRNA (uracil1498-N3)-methyltransferase